MLQIHNLFKKSKNSHIKDIDLKISPGEVISIECSEEISQLLFNLILSKETPSSGEILIDNTINTSYLRNKKHHIGLILHRDSFYERFTINEYLIFFSELLNSDNDYKTIMMKLGLLDVGDVKIRELSYSQKRRLSFARERLKDLKLLLFQDPLLNLDKDAARIILNNINELKEAGVSILNTSTSFKDCILLGGKTYILDEEGIEEIQSENQIDSTVQDDEKEDLMLHHMTRDIDKQSSIVEEQPLYRVDKIQVKNNDRILLINPKEIDYIESEKSVSFVSVRGERFSCPLTLNELEERLKYLGFFRTHRSYLVNLQRVRELVIWTRNSYSLILEDKNKSTIPLSKGRIDELKEILNL